MELTDDRTEGHIKASALALYRNSGDMNIREGAEIFNEIRDLSQYLQRGSVFVSLTDFSENAASAKCSLPSSSSCQAPHVILFDKATAFALFSRWLRLS